MIGNIILEKRKEKRLSQNDLAEKAGLNIRTIQLIEKGHYPSMNTIYRVAEALDLELCLRDKVF